MVGRCDGHGRHLGVDQRDGTVLHLGGGVALGVDVGDLLELQRPFECRGVVVSAPQADEGAGIGEDFREVGDLRRHLEHLLERLGQVKQCRSHLVVIRLRDGIRGDANL